MGLGPPPLARHRPYLSLILTDPLYLPHHHSTTPPPAPGQGKALAAESVTVQKARCLLGGWGSSMGGQTTLHLAGESIIQRGLEGDQISAILRPQT
jgi:hypothetical protein